MTLPLLPINRLLIILSVLLATSSYATEDPWDNFQIHGFASQSFIISDNNQLHGDSKHGTGDFFELGINASWQAKDWLLFSLQGAAIGRGNTQASEPKLDVYQVDYRPFDNGRQNFGIRLGKVRVSQGLHNESRDVAASRPGIFMPQSVYLDGLRLRELLFSQEAAQLYYEINDDGTSWRADVAVLNEQTMDAAVESAAFRSNLDGEFEVTRGGHARLLSEKDGGAYKYGITYNDIYAEYSPAGAGDSIQYSILDYDQYTLFAQANYENWSFTSEFNRRFVSVFVNDQSKPADEYVSLGGYVEARRRFCNGWQAFIRYDELVQKGSDRSGREREAVNGRPRYYAFARDWGVGVSKEFKNGISLHGEFHYVDGVETLDINDNPDYLSGTLDRYWNYAGVMLAYKF